jgi:hypothetical protein
MPAFGTVPSAFKSVLSAFYGVVSILGKDISTSNIMLSSTCLNQRSKDILNIEDEFEPDCGDLFRDCLTCFLTLRPGRPAVTAGAAGEAGCLKCGGGERGLQAEDEGTDRQEGEDAGTDRLRALSWSHAL